ncbi:hypothetical protein D5086_009511 [Populus alba]|uniref:Uncharacterized protein n=2 Tax=Populus alba TaxID=43335 RepID=A0ACC4CIU0_POPAL|nr:hypothetical protein D5086_0000243310 [Populus alba]
MSMHSAGKTRVAITITSIFLEVGGNLVEKDPSCSYLSSHLKHKVAGKLVKKSLPAHPKRTAILSESMVRFNFYAAIDVQDKVGCIGSSTHVYRIMLAELLMRWPNRLGLRLINVVTQRKLRAVV